MKVLQKLFNGIKTLLSENHPKTRQLYAVTGGKYLGECFLYIKTESEDIHFLSLPSMESRVVTAEKFKYGLENKILDPIEVIPTDVYNLCTEHYNNINN